jgi:serine protease AprX
MRLYQERTAQDRSSALWTKGGRSRTADSERGNVRSSALWGKGGRGFVALIALVLVFAAPPAALAGAHVSKSLRSKAKASPYKLFNVIVQGDELTSRGVAKRVRGEGGKVKKNLRSVNGVSARLSGKAILKLARRGDIFAITPDAPVYATESGSGSLGELGLGDLTDPLLGDSSGSGSAEDQAAAAQEAAAAEEAPALEPDPAPAPEPEPIVVTASAPVYSPAPQSSEMWRETVHADVLWSAIDLLTGAALEAAPQAPTIAIVDSGVDPSKVADFGGRLLANVNISSLSPGAHGDGQGHGTLVAGIAAGGNPAHLGAAPNAPLVSIRTSDAEGRSLTSDVIAAADWILANKDAYGIRVANFSLAGSVETSFRYDPLDRAVERLWFAGVVVVAAAGNHGAEDGSQVTMAYAPGNDPFIITVGALDQAQTSDPYDDTVPWWSGKGYTMDGFSKPDMAAPGRYMVGPVPADATMAAHAPERVVEAGYMWMSGTSFAAPVVAGLAAQLLSRHPDWGPDEVKGALMLTSAYLGVDGSGVGEVDALSAASLDFTPPNPNENFYPFVEVDEATGYRNFNAANWAQHVETEANWAQANWAQANWAQANWAQANWAQAAWSSANWAQSLESSMTSSASWNE